MNLGGADKVMGQFEGSLEGGKRVAWEWEKEDLSDSNAWQDLLFLAQ